jgi:SAM-dependent methyltransferase
MKRSAAQEMMDFPGQPKDLLIGNLGDLRFINRYIGCHRTVINGLAQVVEKDGLNRFTLLDVGAGSGDVATAIVRWARRRGIVVRISALERAAITVEQAVEQTRYLPEIGIVQGDALAPPFRAGSFDFVLASQVLHHFTDDEIVDLLRGWGRLAHRAIIIADLVRHPLAYHGIRLLTRALTQNKLTRFDAPLSVQRACTIAEWRELMRRANIGKCRIEPALPFRMLGVISVEGRS